MMNENTSIKKKITINKVILGILIGILFLGGTYALVSVILEVTNGRYAYNATCFDINYSIENISGTSNFSGTLEPSASYTGGLSGNVSIGIDPVCNVKARGNLYLNINSSTSSVFNWPADGEYCIIEDTLETLPGYTNSASCENNPGQKWVSYFNAYPLKYAVIDLDSSELVSSGYVNASNSKINLYENFELSTWNRFQIYIWLDGNMIDDSYADVTFSGFISADASQYMAKPEKPRLDNGMIPVTIDDDGTVFTVSEDDSRWYDYDEQRWANAVLVKENGIENRNYYKSPGREIEQEDILAYYVWIPRYRYRIPYNTCSDIPEDERNMEDYPECYAPYTMVKSDKNKLVSYYEGYKYCSSGSSDKIELSKKMINYLLQTGRTNFEGLSIHDWVGRYNNGTSNCYGTPDETDLTLTSSAFNGNNRLYGAGNEVSIDIEFETVNDSLSNGDAVNTYYTHPAFTWDGEAVSGIWVGKFETTPDKSDACYTTSSLANCNDTTQNPTILPNEAPLVYQYIGNQFATSQNFTKLGNVYGLSNGTTDGHMMKNSEWGAVAYLSHSTYGINKEIAINNYYNQNTQTKTYYKTGCGALDGVISLSSICTNAYSTDAKYPQSTTGNITGVFDISGGALEYVMGNYNNTTNTYFSTLPESKYYDVYLEDQFSGDYLRNMSLCTLETCGGHALLETVGWYNDYEDFVSSVRPWFMRGGSAIDGSDAGAWGSSSSGGDGSGRSWRSVLVVESGA